VIAAFLLPLQPLYKKAREIMKCVLLWFKHLGCFLKLSPNSDSKKLKLIKSVTCFLARRVV